MELKPSPENIIDQDEKLILGLIWGLMRKFVRFSDDEGEGKHSSPSGWTFGFLGLERVFHGFLCLIFENQTLHRMRPFFPRGGWRNLSWRTRMPVVRVVTSGKGIQDRLNVSKCPCSVKIPNMATSVVFLNLGLGSFLGVGPFQGRYFCAYGFRKTRDKEECCVFRWLKSRILMIIREISISRCVHNLVW